MANSDCVLFMGTNTAEAHPVAFRWPMKAKEKGATLIHVDPRFTRTSAMCDVYVGIRAGSDIAFLGGLVNYVLGCATKALLKNAGTATMDGASTATTFTGRSEPLGRSCR